jgi:GcrA cell cycle regulator
MMPAGAGTFWTETRVQVLRQCHSDGMSGGEIARELGDGITRNAVVAKIIRLGLPKRVIVKRKTRQLRHGIGNVRITLNTPRKPRQSRQEGQGMAFHALGVSQPPGLTDLPAIPTPASAVDIFGLTSTTCRWPLGEPGRDMLYCGAAKDDAVPYCRFHCQMAYRARGES